MVIRRTYSIPYQPMYHAAITILESHYFGTSEDSYMKHMTAQFAIDYNRRHFNKVKTVRFTQHFLTVVIASLL